MSARRKNRGSISLEAAITVPMVLMLTTLMIIRIIGIQVDIKVKGALDKTASELALLSPVGLLLDNSGEANDHADPETGNLEKSDPAAPISDVFQDLPWREMLSDVFIDGLTTNLAGPVIHSRLEIWLKGAMQGRPGLTRMLGKRSLFLDWNISRNQLWLCLSYQLLTPAGPIDRQAFAVVPLWLGQKSDEIAEEKDQIWLMDNFSRGKKFRKIFGANLPDDFPVIARFDAGEATMIRSMDLTAPTYASHEPLWRRLNQHLSDLSGFRSAAYSKSGLVIKLDPGDIERKRLILVIPENSPQVFLSSLLLDFSAQATAGMISLQIIRYGRSARYSVNEDS